MTLYEIEARRRVLKNIKRYCYAVSCFNLGCGGHITYDTIKHFLNNEDINYFLTFLGLMNIGFGIKNAEVYNNTRKELIKLEEESQKNTK